MAGWLVGLMDGWLVFGRLVSLMDGWMFGWFFGWLMYGYFG